MIGIQPVLNWVLSRCWLVIIISWMTALSIYIWIIYHAFYEQQI